jgi:predicted nucleotidyltransferase
VFNTLFNDPSLVDACKKYRVRELYLFGSAVLQDLEKSNDIDLLVTFERDGFEGAFEQFMGFKETLEHILGKPVDLITDKQFRNPLFREELEATKELIYAA